MFALQNVCVGMIPGRAWPSIQQTPFISVSSSNLLIVSISSPGLRMEISHQTATAHKMDPSRALSSALRLQRGVRDLPDCDFIPGSLQTSSSPRWGRRGLQKAVKPHAWQARQGRSFPH